MKVVSSRFQTSSSIKYASKPGHRKILALFLVDPHLKVLSTANVPCQQRDWWREHIAQLSTRLDLLPVELWDAVFDGVIDDFPFSLDEAKDLRLKLMDERKAFVIRHDEAFKGMEFSLCEHRSSSSLQSLVGRVLDTFFSSLFLYREILSINAPECLRFIYLLNIKRS